METSPEADLNLAEATKRVARQLMGIAHNRVELLMVEIHKERERTRLMIFLVAGAGFFGLLGIITLTALIAFAAGRHVLGVLIGLTLFYFFGAAFFYGAFNRLKRDWEILPGTREQLQKDRECLDKLV